MASLLSSLEMENSAPIHVATAIAAAPAASDAQQLELRQVLTQTITYAGYTSTAIVTLGGGPTGSVASPSSDSSSSSGLTTEQVGIIVGCTVGGVILIVLLIWLCLNLRMRQLADDDDETIYSEDYYEVTEAPMGRRREQWESIPPPPVPIYRARPPPRTYTRTAGVRDTTYIRR